MKPESAFWLETKEKLNGFSLIRLESWASAGIPDILGYSDKTGFFTIELKVTSSNKIRFSPHQISFHVQHPKNTFILVKSLATSSWKLYEGKRIRELVACGLKLAACRSSLEACCLQLASLGA